MTLSNRPFFCKDSFLKSGSLLKALLLLLLTTGLTGCGDLPLPFAEEAPPDTFAVVQERYQGGSPQKINYYVGQDSGSAPLKEVHTLSPSGRTLKITDVGGGVSYYHDISPKMDSTRGFRDFLQGMWVRDETIERTRNITDTDIPDGVYRVRSTRARTFLQDTLIVSQYAVAREVVENRVVGQSNFQVGFKVDYNPPNKIQVQEVLYRSGVDSTQMLADTPVLGVESQAQAIDTLRVLNQDRYRILTSIRQTARTTYRRYRSPNRIPSSIIDALDRLERGNTSIMRQPSN